MAWNVDDLTKLSSRGSSLRTEVILLKEDSAVDVVALNIARKLCEMQKILSVFVQGKYICIMT